MTKAKHYDVIINGGGMVGLALVASLVQQNFHVAIIESKKPALRWAKDKLNARVSALNLASISLLKKIEAWENIRQQAMSPLNKMIVWDELGGGEIEFDSSEISKNNLGAIVENREIVKVLWQQLSNNKNVDFIVPHQAVELKQTDNAIALTLDNEKTLTAELLVGADGAQSWVREHAGIECSIRPYEHNAVIAVLQLEKPHQQTAWQCFTPNGPLAVLPIADNHQAVMIWSTQENHADELLKMDAKTLGREISNALSLRLGSVNPLTKAVSIPLIMRHAKHYIDNRIALVGDAAHTIHPLAGQGVNLGFADVICLTDALIEAKQKRWDIGSRRPLRTYERAGKGDNLIMLLAMRSFKEIFISQSPITIQLRSLGLNITNRLDLVKHCFMGYAMGE